MASRLLTTRPRLPPGVISGCHLRLGEQYHLLSRPSIASSWASLSRLSSAASPLLPPGVPDQQMLERTVTAVGAAMTEVSAKIGDVEGKIQKCN